nr:DUF1109 family protein [Caulobacteraceae bacterium]
MKTADLIEALAGDLAPTPPIAMGRRITLAALAGAGGALVILIAWLGLRPLGAAAHAASF